MNAPPPATTSARNPRTGTSMPPRTSPVPVDGSPLSPSHGGQLALRHQSLGG